MTRTLFALAVGALVASSAPAQTKTYALDSVDGLELRNVKAEAVAFKGKNGLRLSISEDAARRLEAMRARRQRAGKKAQKKGGGGERGRVDLLAVVQDLEFSSGTIEAEVAGSPAPGAAGGARGFVGIAFRVQDEVDHYDTFYLRPTNGRAEDQERRNHSAQYISHPDWTWFRFRNETPSRYETYVDIVPDEWIAVKIEVDGEKARLYVNNAEQPTLIVNDVKSGPDAKGKVGLWLEGSTIAHYRNLRITPR